MSPDGVVALVYGAMELAGLNVFQNNLGLTLRVSYNYKKDWYFYVVQVVGTSININGTVIFEENNSQSSQFGGALSIESFGQVRVFPQTNVIFSGNVGRSYIFIQ